MPVASLEMFAHRTWPCRIEDRLGQWLLRAADGFTRRANSCLPLGGPGTGLAEAVDRVEQWYHQRGLQPCFKIVPGVDPRLDPLLQERGWTVATPSRTMVRALPSDLPSPAAPLIASPVPEADWLATVSRWDGETAAKARHHGELARRVPAAGYLRWQGPTGILAVGLVALEGLPSLHNPLPLGEGKGEGNDLRPVRQTSIATSPGRGAIDRAFLYDVVVHPEQRGHGIGRAFCTAALSWASQQGARSMALQVLESNRVARALYTSLGFADHHPYHYRETND